MWIVGGLFLGTVGLIWWFWPDSSPAPTERWSAPQAFAPHDSAVTFDTAMQQMSQYRVDDAERTLRGVLNRYPDSARSREELRWLYFNQFRQGELDQLLEDGLRMRPRDYALAVALLMSEFRPQNPREVLTSWVTAVQKQPDQARVQAALGHCYARVGEIALAEAALQTAMDLAPSDPLVRLRVIEFLVDQGEWEAAQELLDTALSVPPAATTAAASSAESADSASQRPAEGRSASNQREHAAPGVPSTPSATSAEQTREQEPSVSASIGPGEGRAGKQPDLAAEERYEDQLAWNASLIAEARGNLEQALQQIEVALGRRPYELRYVQRHGALLRLLGQAAASARQLERANQLEACIGRLTEIVLSGQLENPSADLCREIAELCTKRGKLLQAEVWRRAAEELNSTGRS